MDEDDLEKRVAELERQLADAKAAKAAAGEDRDAQPESRTDERRLRWLLPALALGLPALVTITTLVPSTALWMSGIVCRSPYQLDYDRSEVRIGGERSYGVSFQCISGESSYDVNDFIVMALQFLLVALVVGTVVALGRWLRGGHRRRSAEEPSGPASELSGAYTYSSRKGNGTWTITPRGPGNADIAAGPGDNGAASFTGQAQLSDRTWRMVVHRPDAVRHRRSGETGPATCTYTWDATTLKGRLARRIEEGTFGRPAADLFAVRFRLTKLT